MVFIFTYSDVAFLNTDHYFQSYLCFTNKSSSGAVQILANTRNIYGVSVFLLCILFAKYTTKFSIDGLKFEHLKKNFSIQGPTNLY